MKTKNLTRKLFFILPVLSAFVLFTGCQNEGNKDDDFIAVDFIIDITDISNDAATVSVIPSRNTPTYYQSVMSKAEYDGLVNDDALVKRVVSEIDNLTDNIVNGYIEEVTAPLNPATEYVAYAFRLEADGKSDNVVYKKQFTTTGTLPDFDYDIVIKDITPMDFIGNFFPVNKSVFYYSNIFTKAEYESLKAGGGLRNAAQRQLNAAIKEAVENSSNYTYETIIDRKIALKGHSKKEYIELEEETEYIVWTATIDARGNMTSNPTVKTDAVKTEKLVFTEGVDVSFTLPVYYSGTQLANYDSDSYGYVRGLVLPYMFVETQAPVGRTHMVFLEGDRSDLSDAVLLSKLLRSNQYVTYHKLEYMVRDLVYIGPNMWGPTTICMVGFDANNNYGPVFRMVVDFDENNVGDVQELIDLLASEM